MRTRRAECCSAFHHRELLPARERPRELPRWRRRPWSLGKLATNCRSRVWLIVDGYGERPAKKKMEEPRVVRKRWRDMRRECYGRENLR